MARAILLVTAALLLAAPAAEAATQRYAGPSGTMTTGCTDPNQPCDLASAFSQAQANDEVIIETGDYGSSGAPLTTPIVSTTAGLDVHGEDGKPRPRVFGATTTADTSVLDLSGAGTKLRNLEIRQLGTALRPVALTFDGAQADGVVAIATATTSQNRGCVLLGSSVLTNSVCEATGNQGVAIFPYRFTGSPLANSSTIRNVTAIASGSNGMGIEAIGGSTASDDENLSVTNTIVAVPSGQTALYAFKQTGDATITIDHSNFGFQGPGPGPSQGQIVKGAGNQQLVGAPTFVAPGDYHIAAGSITIDKGVDDSANGPLDVDRGLRTLGQATDMGAYEFVPPPVVTTGVADFVTRTSADVFGTVNPERLGTSYHFEYGTSTSYGTSTPAADGGSGTADAPVNVNLTGLLAGTTYHYRLVATNAGGTTLGADRTFTTQSAPGGGGTGAGPHFVGPLKLAAKVTFTLDRAATVRFTVERASVGRRAGKRCVKATKKNRKAKKCTRYVRLKGRLDRASTAGKNSFKFTRRWNGKKLPRGRYRLVAVALNAAGKPSDTRRASFRVVKH